MTIKAVLFDFDGTIANTQDAFLEIVNDLADEFGYPQIDYIQLERLKNLSSLKNSLSSQTSQKRTGQKNISPRTLPIY
jgi:phosphoglycolate phosphatase